MHTACNDEMFNQNQYVFLSLYLAKSGFLFILLRFFEIIWIFPLKYILQVSLSNLLKISGEYVKNLGNIRARGISVIFLPAYWLYV